MDIFNKNQLELSKLVSKNLIISKDISIAPIDPDLTQAKMISREESKILDETINVNNVKEDKE